MLIYIYNRFLKYNTADDLQIVHIFTYTRHCDVYTRRARNNR